MITIHGITPGIIGSFAAAPVFDVEADIVSPHEAFADPGLDIPQMSEGRIAGLSRFFPRMNLACVESWDPPSPDEILGSDLGSRWRESVLPLALEALGTKGRSVVEAALKTFENREASLDLRPLALRVLDDRRAGIDEGVETYLHVLQSVVSFLESEPSAPTELKSMARWFLRRYAFLPYWHPVNHRPGFFGWLLDRIPPARRIVYEFSPFSSHGGRSLTKKEIGSELLAAVERHLPADDPKVNPYLFWPLILSGVLGIHSSGEALLKDTTAVFSDPREPLYRRALALVYYDYSFPPGRGRLFDPTVLRSIREGLNL